MGTPPTIVPPTPSAPVEMLPVPWDAPVIPVPATAVFATFSRPEPPLKPTVVEPPGATPTLPATTSTRPDVPAPAPMEMSDGTSATATLIVAVPPLLMFAAAPLGTPSGFQLDASDQSPLATSQSAARAEARTDAAARAIATGLTVDFRRLFFMTMDRVLLFAGVWTGECQGEWKACRFLQERVITENVNGKFHQIWRSSIIRPVRPFRTAIRENRPVDLPAIELAAFFSAVRRFFPTGVSRLP